MFVISAGFAAVGNGISFVKRKIELNIVDAAGAFFLNRLLHNVQRLNSKHFFADTQRRKFG